MAVEGKIADGVIKIALSGYEKVKGQLASVKKLVDGATKGKSSGGKAADGAGKVGKAVEKGASSGILGEVIPLLARFAPLVVSAGAAAAVLGTALTVVAGAVAAVAAGVTAFSVVVGALVKVADPVRFTAFATKLEVAAIIIGRQFIPILQTLLIIADKVNDALREAFSTRFIETFSKAVGANLERFVNSLLPAFRKGLAAIERMFGLLIPVVDQFGNVFDDIANMFVDSGFVEDFLEPLSLLFVELAQLAANLSTFFGAAFQGFLYIAVQVVGLLIKALWGLVNILNKMAEVASDAFKEAVDVLIDGLNLMIDALNEMLTIVQEVADAIGSLAGIEVGELRIGNIEKPDYDRRRRRPERPELGRDPQLYIQPQFVGLEELYKKANTASQNDPRKEADLERKRQLDRVIANTAETADNTRRRGMASGMGGDWSGAEGAGASLPDF